MVAKWYLLAAIVAGAFLAGTGAGWNLGANDRVAHYEPILKDYAVRANQAEAEYRKIERESAAHVAAVADRLTQEKANAQAEYERTIADLAAGNLRVRDRLTACSRRVSKTAPDPPRGDDRAESGFSAADAELVLRIAAEADQVVRQLTACQGMLRR